MDNRRLFIAIDLPETLKQRLNQVQQTLPGANIKWVVPNNLHLTLKFLGETPAASCLSIIGAIHQTGTEVSAFNLTLKGVSTFPERGRPRVIWACIEGETEKLLELQRCLEKGLEGLGFPREKRTYAPHLTLGRTQEYGSLEELQRQIPNMKHQVFGQWTVSAIKLIQSTLMPSGPLYKTLETVMLEKSGV